MPKNERLDTSIFSQVTDIDVDVAVQNALERGDSHIMQPLLVLMHSNPRFLFRLLAEASKRGPMDGRSETESLAHTDGFLEGVALTIATQLQHEKAEELPTLLPPFVEGVSPAA